MPYIKSSYSMPFGKIAMPLIDMAVEVGRKVIMDSNRKPDAVIIGSMLAEELYGIQNIASKVVDNLGLYGIPAFKIDTASSTGALLVHEAIYRLYSKDFSNILVIGAEKMNIADTKKVTTVLSHVLSDNEQKHGATMPSMAALIAKNYMKLYNAPYEAFAHVAIKNHHNATLNPISHLKKEITLQEVLSSKFIAEPLRLYDCAPISDGATAMMISKEKGEIEIIGIGQATDNVNLLDRNFIDGFYSTQMASRRAFEMAGIKVEDIGVAEIHDAFTPFEIIGMEDIGISKKGEGWKEVMDGKTSLIGKIPVNPSGGLKARGHPVSVSGLAQIEEIFLQLSNKAGKRQVDSKIGIAQSIGGLATNNFVTILRRA